MTGQKSYFGKDSITPSFLKNTRATESLKGLESAALGNHASTSDPKLSELNLGFYTGSGRAKRSAKSSKHTKAKRGASILLILATLFFGGLTIVGSPSILGPHLEALITEATDTQYASYNLRARHLMTEMLDGKIKLTPYMKGRLEKSGITVTGHGNKVTLDYKGNTIDSSNFKDFYNNDLEFREAYASAKRGRVANFFDDAAESVYRRLGLSRDVFSNYKSTGNDDVDDGNYKSTMSRIFDGETDTKLNSAEDKVVKDEETGEEVVERTKTGEDIDTRNIDGDTPTAKASSYLSAISGKVATANIGCTAIKVGNMIAVAVAANEIYQSINYFNPSVENISKAKAGYGSQSALNPMLNKITKSTTTTMIDADTGEEISVTGAPIEAEGMKLILTNTPANKNITKNFSIERLFAATLSAVALKESTVASSCNLTRATGAVLSLTLSTIPGGGLVKAVVGTLLDVTLAVGLQAAISAILGFMIPTIAQTLFTNIFTSTEGKPSGEILAKGAAASNMRVARSSSGQSPASAEAILAYNQSTQAVIAEDAELDRKNRSPFDTSSPNTFLGSIVSKFTPLLSTSNSITTAISSVASVVKSTINPLTYASGEGTSYITTFNDCPVLEDKLGAKGDLYCNAITAPDISVLNIPTDDEEYRAVIEQSIEIDEDGNEKIKDNSEGANYIIYCGERDSPFGIYDPNIANAFESSLGIVGDNLPILNDVVDIVNAAESEAAEPWATGLICTNSSKNPDWSRIKYYQRYIEDVRIKNQMGFYEDGKDPVTAFKEHYYELHPLDNSRAGYLARIAGLSKDDAETVIAIHDYLNIIKDYDATTAYQFGETNTDHKIFFEETITSPSYITVYTPTFINRRQEITA